MKRLLCPTGFALASLLTVFAEPSAVLPVNSAGQPLHRADGTRINYSQAESAVVAEKTSTAKTATAMVSGPSDSSPVWQYSVFGTAIGAAGIRVTDFDGVPHIFVSGSGGGGFWQNDFWQVLRHTGGSEGYSQVFVSRTCDSQLMRLLLGKVTGTNLQVLAVLANGEVWIHDAQSRRVDALLQTLPSVSAACLADLDGDGLQEIIAVGSTKLAAFSGSGTMLWHTNITESPDVVAAQMDGDPSLEIAVSGGQVIDATTHGVQWNYSPGFGPRLVIADGNADGRHELIGAQWWNKIEAFDVVEQTSKWTLTTTHDIGAIAVGDVDGDNIPELLWGDGQWGAVHVVDLANRLEKGQVNNPDHGVTFIAVGNVDEDAAKEILWGAGASSTGPDYLHVADATTRAITWSSVHLDGPFLGATVADLDGDGRLELVACSTESNSGYGSGRIVVFDAESRQLRAISPAIGENLSWEGVRQLIVRDVDHDGRAEILIAADRLYDGLLEVYSFGTNNLFTQVWVNTSRPSGSPFNAIEVADLDGTGADELVVGNSVAHTGSPGVFLRVYDFATGGERWTSEQVSGGWYSPVIALAGAELDGDAAKEVVGVARGAGIYVVDGASHVVERSVAIDVRAAAFSPARDRVVVSAENGLFVIYTLTNQVLQGTTINWILSGPADALFWTADDDLWVSSGGGLTRYSISSRAPTWQSPKFGNGFGSSLAFATNGTNVTVFTTSHSSILGLVLQPGVMPTVTISVSTNRIEEEFETTVEIVVRRNGNTNEALSVLLSLTGSATAGSDYTFPPGRLITLPEGAETAVVTVKALNDSEEEPLEKVVVTVQPDTGYMVGNETSVEISIVDDDTPPIPVDVYVSSTWTRETPDQPITISFYRYSYSAVPLIVDFSLAGSAVLNEDYTASATNSIIIPAWTSSAALYLYPRVDAIEEGTEDILFTILPDRSYNPSLTNLHLQIRDDFPLVSVSTIRHAREGAGEQSSGAFTVYRQGGSLDRPLTVYYHTRGSADRGDFVSLPGYVVIPAGSESATITVKPLNDGIAEEAEEVLLTLLPADTYDIGYPNWAEVSIEDNEPTVGVVSHAVDNDTWNIVLGRTGAENRPVRVIYGFRADRNGRVGKWHFRYIAIPAQAVTATVSVPLRRAQSAAFMVRERRAYFVGSDPLEWRGTQTEP